MAEDERQILAAAETLLNESINSQRSIYTQQNVTRTPDIILSEDLIAGAMQNGRMSNVRRFFCLFVTFDLLLTFLMWLICTMIAGESLESAFMNQIVHYHIKTSLFDIVFVGDRDFKDFIFSDGSDLQVYSVVALLCAASFGSLDYCSCKCHNLLTTATTCAFLIAKVFLFDWTICNQPVFQVLLILTSFVLPWVEAWFFDIRVLPQETQARNWFRNFIDNEREPLLRGVISESRQYTNNEHAGTFFTPMDSPDHSDHEDENTRPSSSRGFLKTNEVFPSKPLPKLTSEMIEDYKRRANALVQNCHDLLQSKDWQIQNIMTNGDIIFYINRPKPEGRILKIVGMIEAPASIIVNRLFDEVELLPTWNRLVTESKKLQYIDENTDIVYQATSAQGGGIIGARDFVILRHRIHYGNYYINSGTSVPLTSLPNRNNVVRAENNLSCWAAERLPNEENKCKFTWIINTNLKGWLPQKVVDKSMSTALIDFMSYIRKYMDDTQRSTA
ncbi:steroidogenic acute regulatory protein-like isoform X1 [Apis laboriosa]|uniref:steroidogenic acute regulatory protein-like isoform X1 n=1 Tax=Apis laboriosa TaxID=183418 RepID=UPI001CC77779|nr:steroidogenic acute regulatory protein-like isoform X1 [Apis laboriosa]XP_043804330.1 steroidogenic acute regulatory protein-like isoform X1 [Apis laboriosa]